MSLNITYGGFLIKNYVVIVFLDMLSRLITDVPSFITRKDLRCSSSNKYEEDPLSDEDEYLCKLKY